MALAVLVGLYLIRTGRKPERFAACFLTGLSAVAFFTAMSRGAILCFGATLLAYLLIAGKEERLGLFFTMAAMAFSMVVPGVVSNPPPWQAALFGERCPLCRACDLCCGR